MEDEMNKRENLTSVRFSRVTSLLTEKTPSLIPFEYKFPLVPEMEYKVFLEELQKYDLVEDLPRFVKDILDRAELIKDYDARFKEHLISKDISKREFKEKNPKTKLDILYDWLFSEQLDIGILKL